VQLSCDGLTLFEVGSRDRNRECCQICFTCLTLRPDTIAELLTLGKPDRSLTLFSFSEIEGVESVGASLDDLFDGSERAITDWLLARDLLHKCDCGYSVYSVDAVNEAAQEEYGDKWCDKIFNWACNLSNQFGWMWEEGSIADLDIYHCQYCAESELSLLFDLHSITSRTATKGTPRNVKSVGEGKIRGQKYNVYIDESYSPEFPRKVGGSYAYAAVIVPETQLKALQKTVSETISNTYRGAAPKELKYKRYSKRPRLLGKVGPFLSKFLTETPGVAVTVLYVPSDGYFSEKARTVGILDYYKGKVSNIADIVRTRSDEEVEKAVREAWRSFAFTLAACVAQYIVSINGKAKLFFDPVNAEHDHPSFAMIEEILPKLPIEEPLLRHGDKILTVWPSKTDKRLKKRVRLAKSRSSEKSAGLQVADFVAGDLRTFFDENPEFMDAAITKELLINKNVLFPQSHFVKPVSGDLMKKILAKTGSSFLYQYRSALAHGLISYYTSNGHMRAFDTVNAEFRDMVD